MIILALASGALLFAAGPAAAQGANSAPAFANASESRDVKENRARSSVVGAPVAATDADNDTLYYSLSGTDAATFTIEENSGQLLLTHPLNYERKSSYSVTVEASDRKDAAGNAESAPYTIDATVPVTINVVDVSTTREEFVVDSELRGEPVSVTSIVELDPSPPVFDEIADIRSTRSRKIARIIDESAAIGSVVGAPIVAQDPEQAGPVSYQLGPGLGAVTLLFNIDSSTGQLTTIGELDYESARSATDGRTGRLYFLSVIATDAAGQSQLASIYIYVRDVSGEPAAPGNLAVTPIEEGLDVSWDAVAGATGYRVEWRRMLQGPPGHLTWHGWGILSLAVLAPSSATSYQISGLRPHVPYQVRVSAKNGVGYGAMAFNYDAWQSQIPTGELQGCVPGNNPPFFPEGDTTSRNAADGTSAGRDFDAPITATLDEINGGICALRAPDTQLTYSLDTTTGDHADFNVDAATGQLSTVSTLNRSVKDSYSVTLRATDGKSQWDDADPSIDDSIVVTINVTQGQQAPVLSTWLLHEWVEDIDCEWAINHHPSGITRFYCIRRLQLPRPGQPAAPTFINVQQTSFRVTWTEPTVRYSAIIGYGIQYKLAAAADSAYADVNPTPAEGDTSYDLVDWSGQTVAEGTSYDVRVRARSVNGWGPWSDAATAVTAGSATGVVRRSAGVTASRPPPTPGQPAAPEIINVQQTSFRITWTAPAAGSSAITGYGIQYKLAAAADSAYTFVNPTPAWIGTGYNLVPRSGQSITAGTSYAVRVRARNAIGWGPWSEAATVVTAGSAPVIAVTPTPPPAPGQPAAPTFINVQQTSFRITWTAPAAGSSAITGYAIQYKLSSAADSAYAFVNPTPAGIGTGYNLVPRSGQTVAEGTSYAVRVRARNAEGWGPWSDAATVVTASPDLPAANPAPPANNPPTFASSAATVSVAENTAAGTDIGDAIEATDPDAGDKLTYTLGTTTDDAHFTIDSNSGQLQTSGALDYENRSSYAVTVTATDGGGLAASIAVTITVTDVADTPPGQPAAPEIINIEQTSFRVTWTEPAEGSSTISGYGIQYKLTAAEDSAYADAKPTKRGTVTGYNLVDRSGQSITAGTSYAVRVRAKNAEGWGSWSDPATVVTASPDPPPDTAPANEDEGDEAEADDSGEEESTDAADSYQATAVFITNQGRVLVEWDEVDGAAYYLTRKNGEPLPGRTSATTSYDQDVEENTRYEYRITAYASADNALAVMTAATGE